MVLRRVERSLVAIALLICEKQYWGLARAAMLNTYIYRKKKICIIQQNLTTSFNRIAKRVEGDREEGAGEKRR